MKTVETTVLRAWLACRGVNVSRLNFLGRGPIRVLGIIADAAINGERPPSLLEISRQIGIWQGGAHQHVHRLMDAGLVTKAGNRTLRSAFRWIPAGQ